MAPGEGLFKTCKVCSQVLPPDQFPGDRRSCRSCEKKRKREWNQNNRRRVRYALRGLSLEEYEALVRKNRCPLCRTRSPVRFVLDHDHRSGLSRSLLCDRCNIALGLVNDRVAVLLRSAWYLWVYRAQHFFRGIKRRLGASAPRLFSCSGFAAGFRKTGS